MGSAHPSTYDFSNRKSFVTYENRVDISGVLHEALDEFDLETLAQTFLKEKKGRFSNKHLKKILEEVTKRGFNDDDYDIMFMKMNSKRDGYVTWDEFISYLILNFQQREIKAEFDTLENPIPRAPSLLKSNHRYAINRIIYCPTVRPDRTITWFDGSLISCSRDGTINYWSLDLAFERSEKSTCPNLRVQTTWVTDMVAMPDVSVVCTSSTERDLRFFDTSARKFELRVIFTSVEHSITTMNYWFSEDVNEESKLVAGDMGGNLHIISIDSFARGPFRSKLGQLLLEVRYEQVLKGQVEGFSAIIIPNQHTNFVRQIYFCRRFHSTISCAECPKAGLLMRDLGSHCYIYNMSKGAWCFDMTENGQVLVSGGSDSIVRLWNPFVPQHPIAVLYGHRTAIVQMILQDNGKFLYSLSKDKCIKVWNVTTQACIQNFLGLPQELGEHSDMTTLYNPASRQWIIGSTMIAVLPLSPKQNGEHTDGTTHTGSVSVVLYNPLYRLVVTCGLDSYVVVWDPFDGRRLMAIKEAHTKIIHAEVVPIEITAATFDPGYQRLITGAHDGTLKIWNFNSGTCLRNMCIDDGSEVKRIVWVHERILAMGWNQRVTEFGDSATLAAGATEFYKSWAKMHDTGISCACVRIGQTLVTGTYNGDVIMWRLETGQPYKQYNVSDPTKRIKIQYQKREEEAKSKSPKYSKKAIIARALGKSSRPAPAAAPPSPTADKESIRGSTKGSIKGSFTGPGGKKQSVVSKLSIAKSSLSHTGSVSRQTMMRQRRMSHMPMPDQCLALRRLAVHCMIFLTTRTTDPNIGTLLIAVENGAIQVWSHHINGGFITSFTANHKAGDYIICMTTDANDEFLFTGTSIGYVKTWLIKDYVVGCEVKVSMPALRVQFPFMWGDFFLGRAQRIAWGQGKPTLLNSYRGHVMTVTDLAYIDEVKLLLTSSTDYTVRMWTLGGRYLQTIGTFKTWKPVNKETLNDRFEHTNPPDIAMLGSSTTLRVLRGGATLRKMTFRQMKERAKKEITNVDPTKIYGSRLDEPILGNYYKASVRTTKFHEAKFDTSFPYIPVYSHLKTPLVHDIQMPSMAKIGHVSNLLLAETSSNNKKKQS